MLMNDALCHWERLEQAPVGLQQIHVVNGQVFQCRFQIDWCLINRSNIKKKKIHINIKAHIDKNKNFQLVKIRLSARHSMV